MLLTFWFYFAPLLSFLAANSTNHLVVFDVTETENYFITKCIVDISKRELYWRPTAVLKTVKEQVTSERIFIIDLIKMLNDGEVPFITKENLNDRTLNTTNASYLIIGYFEDCNAMKSFDFNATEDKVKYLIIIQNMSKDICRQNFRGIGSVIGKRDITFFVEHKKDMYDLYTFVPKIDYNTCEVTVGKSVKINTCDKGKLMGKTVFPVKYPTNYKKCPFRVGMSALYPFGVIGNLSSLKNYDRINEKRVKGMDFELIKIILNHFNVTIDVYYIHPAQKKDSIGMEFLGLVWNGSLDICAGGYTRKFGDSVEYSGTYARQKISWMYYTERSTKTWETLIPTVDGLYLFMVFCFSYSVVFYLISTFDNTPVPLMNILLYAWGSLVSSSSLQKARTMKQKILNTVYLIMCLHLAVYINMQLYSFLTIQDPPETFETNDALMKSGKVPYLQSYAKFSLNDEKFLLFANTSKDCKSFEDCAEQSKNNKGMTIGIEGFAINFQVETAVNNEARMLIPAENLVTVYFEMIIRKGHPILKKFQNKMQILIEAGVPRKLQTEAIGVTVVNKASIVTQKLISKSYNCQSGCTITIEQLGGVFYVVIIGYVMSSIIFLVEIVSKKKN